MTIKWAGDNCQVGLWVVGKLFYDDCEPKDSPTKYKAVCKLPGSCSHWNIGATAPGKKLKEKLRMQ